ncbi:mitochondrial 54S ribosomal protein uL10m MRPL11 PWA37_000907 [Arxiozyma heterogenica]|uniref:Ribosomal protein L10 n=1 Tax=Arxiozyma heterogenica TaxID=278026 RepID=A0AAN8A6Y6_9SACH|nr:hypothetical protein RI543_002822 [Kazachstania heterogenica]
MNRLSLISNKLCRGFHTDAFKLSIKYPPIITAKQVSNSKKQKNLRLSVKPLNSKKTLLIDQYKNVWDNNKMIIFCHYNNLLKQEDHQLRLQLTNITKNISDQDENKISFIHIRNNLFKVFLQNMNLEDPVAPYDKKKDYSKLIVNHPLNKLIKGPTAIIAYPKADCNIMRSIVQLISNSKGKLIPLGGVIEGKVLNLDWINAFNQINATQDQLYQMLVSQLSYNAGGNLIDTLQLLSNNLVGSLSIHQDNLSPENKQLNE